MATTTLEEVWALFREVAREQKETARRFQETDRKFQETDQRLERQFNETNHQLKQLGQRIGNMGNRLGEFVEGLIKPAVVRLFQERGISVHEVHGDISVNRNDEDIQIDLLVVNETEAVLVEVKSKLSQADVDDHLERLEKFKRMLPRYRDVRAMGAVAAMVVPQEVARYAYRQGLFVLAQSGESVTILNDHRFHPKAW